MLWLIYYTNQLFFINVHDKIDYFCAISTFPKVSAIFCKWNNMQKWYENQEFNTFEDGTQSMTRNNATFSENKVQTLFLSLSILSTIKVSLNFII